jgi:hypothetical protein
MFVMSMCCGACVGSGRERRGENTKVRPTLTPLLLHARGSLTIAWTVPRHAIQHNGWSFVKKNRKYLEQEERSSPQESIVQ